MLSFIAFETFFTSKFGITFVYKLPGPNIIASALSIASKTPGAGWQFDGEIKILFIDSTFWVTTSGILSFCSITVPSFNSAHIVISSKVTGITFPVILSTSVLFWIASDILLYSSFIPVKKTSPKFKPLNLSLLNLRFIKSLIKSSRSDIAIILSLISFNGNASNACLDIEEPLP